MTTPELTTNRLAISLTREQRQMLLEALFERQMNRIRPLDDPHGFAKWAVLTDQELVSQLLEWEQDGDDEIAKALAMAGLSEREVQIRFLCVNGREGADPQGLVVGVSVAQLRRWAVDHFTVRSMEGFGSLHMDLPIPPGRFALGYTDGALQCTPAGGTRVLSASAVLTNGTDMEPHISFEVARSWPGDYDQVFRTVQLPLAMLEKLAGGTVGFGERVNALIDEHPPELHWQWHEIGEDEQDVELERRPRG